MEKNLIITGPSGVGKSSTIRRVLGNEILSCCGGFITERIQDGQGQLLGFDLFPAAASAGVQGFEGLRFLDYSRTPPTSDNEVFRIQGVRLLEEAAFYPYALVDEFGGFELIIPQFREALLDFLNSPLPFVGVLKSAPNAMELRRRFGLGERFTAYRDALENALRNDPDTRLVSVASRDELFRAEELLSRWKDEYCR